MTTTQEEIKVGDRVKTAMGKIGTVIHPSQVDPNLCPCEAARDEVRVDRSRATREEVLALRLDTPCPVMGPFYFVVPGLATKEASQHPADLKPRGVKDPMHLIPWSVVPAAHRPDALAIAAQAAGRWPDGDPFGSTGPAPAQDWAWRLAQALASFVIVTVGLGAVARAFGYGAQKYRPWNWREFQWNQEAQDSYYGAACRHLIAWQSGQELDPESGVPHLGHVGACALIWSWHLVYGKAASAPRRPQVGDRVRVLSDTENEVRPGTIGVLSEDDGSTLPFTVEIPNMGERFFYEPEIEVVTP